MNKEYKKGEVIISGKSFFYWEVNPESKKVVVLLHGFPGNHEGLLELADNLDNGYRIIIPDLPACGQSAPLEKAHQLKNYSQWLRAFLKNLSIEKTILIGHSFGARVALVFAVNYPKKIEKLILITPVSKVDGFIPKIASLKGAIAKLLPAQYKKAWLASEYYQKIAHLVVFKTNSREKRQEIAAMDKEESKNLNPKATLEIFDEFYVSDLTPVAAKIKARTLVIAGDKDEIATLASVKKMAGQIHGSDLEIMAGAGHLLPLERSSDTANIITRWLDIS